MTQAQKVINELPELELTNPIEVNGPATAIMLLNAMLDDARIDQVSHDKLIALMDKTIDYIKLLDNPNGVLWHEVGKSNNNSSEKIVALFNNKRIVKS